MSNLEDFLAGALRQIEEAGLRRALRAVSSPQGAEVVCDGRPILNFSSNDYLGLAAHPKVVAAGQAALERAGAGAGASRLISGNHELHEELEDAIARFKQVPAVLSFSTGYAAALGSIPALMKEGDVIILDKLCHASLVDAARLSGAHLRVFPHNHLDRLESHLAWAREKYPGANILILVESVYSMDGDLAPLAEIVALKDKFGAWLFVDEAHGVGVLGRLGRGLADELDLSARIEFQMGTLGKALGSSGAYVGGSRLLREFLINRARSFIFSTAPPPPAIAAASTAIKILETAEGAELIAALAKRRAYFVRSAKLASPSAIFPILVGDEQLAVDFSNQLRKKGLWVPAVRYPTVARGMARLRVVITAAHQEAHLDQLANALQEG